MSALLFAAWMAAVPAATPISLDEVRAEGRKNTQALQSLLDATRSEQDVRLARAPLLPQLSFSTSVGGTYVGRERGIVLVQTGEGTFEQRAGETSPRDSGNFEISLSLSQIIYDRVRWKQLAQSGAAFEAAQGQAREQEDASELEAITRFFALYRTQATIRVLEATVQRSEEQLERALALFEAGRVGRGEELAARVNLGNDRINLLLRQAQLAQDRGQLAVWLARPGAEPLEAQAPESLLQPPPPAPSFELALAEARQRRPLLQALQQQVRAASLGQDVASAGYWPRLLAQGSYLRRGPEARPVFATPRLQNTVTGSVALQWDLFTGLSTDAQINQARATLRTAELNLAQTGRELEAEVQRTLQLLVTQIAAAQLAAENRETAARSLSLAEERFKAGAGSTLEVRDAQLKLTQSELTLLENRVNVETARFGLMRAMGTLSPGELK
ncbi:TolC family protein [Stigmatella sp. ncwal1]|uniref:TolC family protein n=1 Tax=Stigmatella ashevillensis TaxID=2995309 RepID=A0ABT5D2P6_9BACT|nr:TolC family protein [Stigmatella ashevillena]MDC0707935.1 TolC family protein [Stigmatella ashevillena]